MKKTYLMLVFLTLFLAYSVNAQIVVFSQNKCYSDKVEEVLKSSKEEFGPFLNAQVDAGNLVNWGILTHHWGDEWNFNIYYSAENMEKFQSAFDEAIKGYVEKYPEGVKKFQSACFEHKDNIYNMSYAYPTDDGEG